MLDAGRHQQRNELSPMTPVDADVCIGCEMLGLGQDGFARIEWGLATRGPASTMVFSATAMFGCEGLVKIARIGRQVGRSVERSRKVGHEIQARRSLLHRTTCAQPPLQTLSHDVRLTDPLSRGFGLQFTQQRG